MEKLVYLLYGAPLQPQRWQALASELRAAGADRLILNRRDAEQWQSVARQNPSRIAGEWGDLDAMLEFWLDCVDDREPLETALRDAGYRLAGYLVTESAVQKAEEGISAGARPGVTQFTAHAKPGDVSEAEFFRNWQAHSRLSFALHPLRWSYIRNAVARPLTEGAPAYRSIVLEHFRTLEDFTDDSRYFGDPAVVQEMFEELAGFCDVASMITGPMAEHGFGS